MVSILTLDEAKAALRLRDDEPGRDDLLDSFLEGVTAVVENEVGWVAPRTEVIDIGGGFIYTSALVSGNILSLTSGADVKTGDAVDVSTMYVDRSGILRNGSGDRLPNAAWRLTAQVGMDPIPEAIKRGAAEILIQAWATQRQIPGEDDVPAFLIPYRAAAWFSSYQNGPSVG